MKRKLETAGMIAGALGVLVYLCNKGKLPITWLCQGVEGIKNPKDWNPSLQFGQYVFGGGAQLIGKQLVYVQSMPFNYVNTFNPLEIKTQGTGSGPVGTIVDVKQVNGFTYYLLNDTIIGDGVYSPHIAGYTEVHG